MNSPGHGSVKDPSMWSLTEASEEESLTSGIPKGSVLGPIYVLTNDIRLE